MHSNTVAGTYEEAMTTIQKHSSGECGLQKFHLAAVGLEKRRLLFHFLIPVLRTGSESVCSGNWRRIAYMDSPVISSIPCRTNGAVVTPNRIPDSDRRSAASRNAGERTRRTSETRPRNQCFRDSLNHSAARNRNIWMRNECRLEAAPRPDAMNVTDR
jgi:hypothetical protein